MHAGFVFILSNIYCATMPWKNTWRFLQNGLGQTTSAGFSTQLSLLIKGGECFPNTPMYSHLDLTHKISMLCNFFFKHKNSTKLNLGSLTQVVCHHTDKQLWDMSQGTAVKKGQSQVATPFVLSFTTLLTSSTCSTVSLHQSPRCTLIFTHALL